MRKTLFKGKRVDEDKSWVYGDLIHLEDKVFILPISATFSNCLKKSLIEIDPNTLAEYSGRADKNEHMIFEGHILKYEDQFIKIYYLVTFEKGCFGVHIVNQEEYGKVVDSKEYFTVFTAFDDQEYYCRNVEQTLEIVGNKWDNSELLEKTL